MTTRTQIPLPMVGEDSNAFAILGRAQRALRQANQSELWDEFHDEATSGDYDHLLATCTKWFIIDPIGDDGEDW